MAALTRAQQAFILEHGRNVRATHLAHVLGVEEADVRRFRANRQAGGFAPGTAPRRRFADLFARWHGRPPRDEEWPVPRKAGGGFGRSYEWLAPERTLLASLVGRHDVRTIAGILTERLQRLTGDPHAARKPIDVRRHINRLGLQTGDLVGGLTTREAAAIVGRMSLINQAIYNGQLRTFRVGWRHVIPRAEFERWLSLRENPPEGWVRLSSLRERLGISSDGKLPEYAALGFIPDVRLVKGIGTARGVWYIAPERAEQILADARAGRKLPWHGKPLPGNQLAMWRTWQRRKHRRCARCRAIWQGPAPATFEAFCARYSSLSLGEKRHLTVDRSKPRRGSHGWRPRGSVAQRMRQAGLTVYAAARELEQPTKWIRRIIRLGVLGRHGVVRDTLGGEAVRITPVGMAMLRGIALGEASRDRSREKWVGVHVAAQIAGVCITTVHRWRKDGEVRVRRGGRGLEFSVASLHSRARTYWAWAVRRYRRAAPPAWLRAEQERAA